MILGLAVGDLSEPLTGRSWAGPTIRARCQQRAAYYASRGMRSTDRVFMHHGNTLEFFGDLLAVWSLGGCVVPIDPRLTPFQVEVLARAAAPRFSLWRAAPESAVAASLAALGVRVLETLDDEAGELRATESAWPPGRLSLDQDALVLYTSGTTGQPKGVVHTHRSLRARWTSLQARLSLSSFQRTLCLLPTHFGHGLVCNALFPWLFGQALFVVPPFRADLVLQLGTLLDAHRITFLSSVPSLWRLALKTARPPQTRSLERVICGSAPLSAALWRGIQDWSGAREVLNVYGMTETASWLAGTTMPDVVPEDGLVGEAWGGVLAVVRETNTPPFPAAAQTCRPGEPGHVWVNTPALMKGYLGRDDLTAEVVSNGWLATGDIGLLDDRGRLYLRGRVREEINRGGTKVYPADVDAVIERFEAAVDVCTFGYEDAVSGEEVAVAVVLRTRDEQTLRRLDAWVRRHLAPYQLPRRWYVLDAIPVTERGKVSRAALAERCAALMPLDLAGIARGGPGPAEPDPQGNP